MSEFNFKSSICTSLEQSERLLALGLKKETADCYLFEYEEGKYKVIAESWLDLIADEKYYSQYKDVCFPAWSLGRLLEVMRMKASSQVVPLDNTFDKLIEGLEIRIKDGYFNKEYLWNDTNKCGKL